MLLPGDTPYNGLYREASASPEMDTFSRLLVYERVGKSVDFLKVLYFSPGWFVARSVAAQSALKLASLIFKDLKRSTCSKSRKSVISVCKKAQKGYQMGFMAVKVEKAFRFCNLFISKSRTFTGIQSSNLEK